MDSKENLNSPNSTNPLITNPSIPNQPNPNIETPLSTQVHKHDFPSKSEH